METVAWSPDGMRLAVGCDEGELVMYSMATAAEDSKGGVEIKAHTIESDKLRHETRMVAMHWALVGGDQGKPQPSPSEILRNRHAAFAPRANNDASSAMRPAEQRSALVTADESGRVGIWWDGLVLVAMISLQDHWGQEGHDAVCRTIHSVMLASDISALFVDISYGDSSDRHVLRLDLRSSLQAMQRDLDVVSRVGYEVRSILELVRTSLRQITSEWKNATRVFELKMSLIGSLYEKYGYDEPPQVDMLAIIAGGITPPGLAQYFAQDIQEMSLIRMQKMFFSGCDTIHKLVDATIKCNLQRVLFEVAELRGAVKWNRHAFHQTLGISTQELDSTMENVGLLLLAMEQLGKALDEMRQDFALFFMWLLERIRVHTNDGNAARTTAAVASQSAGGSTHKSLLNVRRLTSFLERAAREAKTYQEKQKTNKYQVEVTFGNAVSKLFTSLQLTQDITAIDARWNEILTRMIRSLSQSVAPSGSFDLSLGSNVDEVVLHTRWMPNSRGPEEFDGAAEGYEDSDDDGDAEFGVKEAVDWDSLESIRVGSSTATALPLAHERTPVTVVAARRGLHLTFYACKEGLRAAEWSVGVLHLGMLGSNGSSQQQQGQVAGIHRIGLYGGIHSGKPEQLVVVCDTREGEWQLYLVHYDAMLQSAHLHASELSPPSLHEKFPTCSFLATSSNEAVKCRPLRNAGTSSSSGQATKYAIISQASRGVVCVVSRGTFLSILDAEEAVDEDDDEDDNGHNDDDDQAQDSDDHDEMDL